VPQKVFYLSVSPEADGARTTELHKLCQPQLKELGETHGSWNNRDQDFIKSNAVIVDCGTKDSEGKMGLPLLPWYQTRQPAQPTP
jgi:hypothetical protein